jgi:hypothetical protein
VRKRGVRRNALDGQNGPGWQETVWGLKNNCHPVKADLLRKELGRIPEAGDNAGNSAGDPGG